MPDDTPSNVPSTPPVAPADESPRMPPPSATVEPFVSAGGPPPTVPAPPKRTGKALGIITAIVLIAGAAVAFYTVPGLQEKFGFAKPTPTATPTATPTPTSSADAFDASLQDVDTSMDKLDSDLTGTDTSLDDKQGDLSE